MNQPNKVLVLNLSYYLLLKKRFLNTSKAFINITQKDAN